MPYECNQRAVMTKRGQKVVIDENGKREVTKLADSAELQKLIKPNDWNEYVIIARGPEIILKINGAGDVARDRPREGQGRRRRA